MPEAIAAAVVGAVERPAGDRWLGLPAVQAILGAMLAPGLTDRYLARTAYEGQLSETPVRPGDPDTLLGPASTDHGARGRFGGRAKESVHPVDPSHLRSAFALAGSCLVAGAFLFGARLGGGPVGVRRRRSILRGHA